MANQLEADVANINISGSNCRDEGEVSVFGSKFYSFQRDLNRFGENVFGKDKLIQKQGELIFQVLGCCNNGTITDLGFKVLIKSVLIEAVSFQQEDDGDTPLHFAAFNDQADCLQVLLSKNPDPEYQAIINNDDWTALHIAALYGYVESVRVLAKNSKVDYCDASGQTPLHLAADSGETECVKVLLQSGLPKYREMIDNYNSSALHLASTNGHIECVKELLKESNPEYREMRDVDGATALHFSTCYNSVECLKVLLEDSRRGYREIADNVEWSNCALVCYNKRKSRMHENSIEKLNAGLS
eukprot:TRINITY_DN4217_c2_g1_i2.p1 TRINITY_DN4217_c2_g1~~TRINITY_DN4217_c2_g1_i2.p1  ORF type:complete len:300 (+),score=51.20 TRINITY_DN4217_c2_g1_i2:163-1062(+)